MLSDVIRNMVERQPDMQVVQVLDPTELPVAIKEIIADVIIISASNTNGDAIICDQLLKEHPLLQVITLSAKCDTAFLYRSDAPKMRIDEPSEQVMLDAIRECMR